MSDHHVYYYYLFLIITVARNQRGEKKKIPFSGLLMGIAMMDSDSPQYIG